MADALRALHQYVTPLHSPLHPYLPFAPIDIFGAIRLSHVVNWFASGVFDPPPVQNGVQLDEKSKRRKISPKPRATLLQECMGILVIVFGGETFLALCSRSPPSWLISPKVPLLFALTHVLQTRTPLRALLPERPGLFLELLLSIPDAIGRALLLTRFSIIPLIHPPTGASVLPATPSTLLLVPFILAAPFASLAISGFNLFAAAPFLSLPLELRPGGWMMVDAWLPLVIPAVFCSLIGPIPGWGQGWGWGEAEAIVACIGLTWAAFAGRAVYNFGSR